MSRLMLSLLAIVSLLPLNARSEEPTTEVGKLAASLKPGQWKEFKCKGYDVKTLMPGNRNNLIVYSGRAAWDAVSRQALFVCQDHLQGPPSFLVYAAKTNSWRRMPTPKWAEKLKFFHAYENNAADSPRGVFFHHPSYSRIVHRYDVAKKTWTTLPNLPNEARRAHGTALVYFPEMKGLVRVVGNDEVWFWSEKKNGWSQLASKRDMGPYHNFANYSPKFKLVLFGGGNGSKAIYRLDAEGKITAGKSAPVYLGVSHSLNVVDPVSGELLVLSREKKLLAYNPGKDEWRELSTSGGPIGNYGGHSVSAASLSNYGVILYFTGRRRRMKTYLYKHAEK